MHWLLDHLSAQTPASIYWVGGVLILCGLGLPIPEDLSLMAGGYMAYVTGTSKFYQDIHPTDVYWCMADIGWITGHSYIVYGPLSLAATP